MKAFKFMNRFFKLTQFQPPSKEVMTQIYNQITQSVEKAYQNQKLKQLYHSVSTKYLLDTAVQMYVGSKSCPRNVNVVNKLLGYAKINSSPQQLLNVEYYEAYLQKLDALAQADEQKFQHSSQRLLQLANQGHPIANHLVGKQTYKVAKNILQKKKKKQKNQLLQNSIDILSKAAQKGSYHSLYLLGCLFEEGDTNKIDYQTAFNYFLLAASYDNPYAFFKLADYYKQGKHVKKDTTLYLYYLKKASQSGVCEAQHNLAIQYLNGINIPKDQLKAFAWFYHAGQHGFSHSKYNAAMILLLGSECGRIKPNIKAALIKFEQVNKQGDIDAQNIINKLIVLQKDKDWLQKLKQIKKTFK